jgi:hypothetical protein
VVPHHHSIYVENRKTTNSDRLLETTAFPLCQAYCPTRGVAEIVVRASWMIDLIAPGRSGGAGARPDHPITGHRPVSVHISDLRNISPGTRPFEDVATGAWPIDFAMISANCVAGRDRGKGLPVLSARQFIGAATTALSLITGAFLLAGGRSLRVFRSLTC